MRIGDPTEFAIDLDWLDPGPSSDHLTPSDAATWAGFKLFISGTIVTANVDVAGRYSESVFGSPLPLCDWALSHWNSLIGTEERPQRSRIDNPFIYVEELESYHTFISGSEAAIEDIRRWWESHNLRGTSDGLALPDVFLWRQGPWMTAWWQTDKEPFAHSNLKFVPAAGSAQLSVKLVVDVFTTLFEVLEDRLNSQGVSDTEDWRAEAFRRANLEIESQASVFRSLFAESGLDAERFSLVVEIPESEVLRALEGYAPTVGTWKQISDTFDIATTSGIPSLRTASTGSGVLALFRSAAPTLTRDDILELKRIVSYGRSIQVSSAEINHLQHELRELERFVSRVNEEAFRVGQRRARTVRELLEIGPSQPVGIEMLLQDLLDGPVVNCGLSDVSIDGVTLWSDRIGPLVAVNTHSKMGSTAWGRRMALAHELCHVLFDSLQGRTLGIASGDWAPLTLEKIANAFAAEFLLPRSALAAHDRDWEMDSNFQWLMNHFEVGAHVAAYQLKNHGFIREDVAQVLIARFGTPYMRG
jgi:hypothetical protein